MPQFRNHTDTRKNKFHSKKTINNWMLPFVVLACAIFVWLTSLSLPEVVAAHFIASGEVNGYMPKKIYSWLMIALVVISPMLIAYLARLTLNSPNARINIPNREYWLAPERRQDTINKLSRDMMGSGVILAVFLSYVHWLVVKANTLNPPMLSKHAIITAIVILIIAMLLWSWLLIKPFRKIPR
jgi:hypothetical protein